MGKTQPLQLSDDAPAGSKKGRWEELTGRSSGEAETSAGLSTEGSVAIIRLSCAVRGARMALLPSHRQSCVRRATRYTQLATLGSGMSVRLGQYAYRRGQCCSVAGSEQMAGRGRRRGSSRGRVGDRANGVSPRGGCWNTLSLSLVRCLVSRNRLDRGAKAREIRQGQSRCVTKER